MKYCDWCKKRCNETTQVSSVGNLYNICPSCNEKLQQGICRICGQPLGFNSIEGKCLTCTQLDYTESKRKQEEMCLGIDPDVQRMFSSPLEFTDEDYERWMTHGLSEVDPEARRSFRRSWVLETFNGRYGWTRETLMKEYPIIEKLLDRNFSKLMHRQVIMVDLSISNTKAVTCVDREGSIVILESSNN